MPEGTQQSCLQNPPGRFVWVARFRHPKLQEMHKRPTRSKSYRPTDATAVTEHQSFQIAVAWLWQRFAMICTSGKQPQLIEDALQDCSICKDNKGNCSIMSSLQSNWMELHQCANPPQSDGSGAGSIWSADGTSATESSCNEKATATRLPALPHQLPASGQKRQLVSQRRPTVVDIKASKTTSLLLVGDSNASGYCETQPYAKSLRCHLSDRFAVVTAAKAGKLQATLMATSISAHQELQRGAVLIWCLLF